MAPPKSNGRKLPITELARPFFLKQFAMQEAQREQAEKDGKPYYDNDLVVAKPDGAPISAAWVSSQFGKLLEDLDMPLSVYDLRHTELPHAPTGEIYTVPKYYHACWYRRIAWAVLNFEPLPPVCATSAQRKKEVLALIMERSQAYPAKAEKPAVESKVRQRKKAAP